VAVTLESLKYWYSRLNAAQFNNEPIYVTHEEFRALKNLEAERQREEMLRPVYRPDWGVARLPHFFGTPVIIDEEKAAERKAKWLCRST